MQHHFYVKIMAVQSVKVCDLWEEGLVPGAYFNLRCEVLSKSKTVQLCIGEILILKGIDHPTILNV